MIKEIALVVCDKCDSVMQANADGEVYMCLLCNKPMKSVKFVRRQDKHKHKRKRELDGATPCPDIYGMFHPFASHNS